MKNARKKSDQEEEREDSEMTASNSSLLHSAVNLLNAGRYEEAFQELKRAISRNIPFNMAHAGDLFYERGEKEKARYLYEMCIELENDPECCVDVGRILFEEGNYEKALSYFMRAMKESAEAEMFAGSIYLARGDIDTAFPLLQSAARRGCESSYFPLAIVHLMRNSNEEARTWLSIVGKNGNVGIDEEIGLSVLENFHPSAEEIATPN